MFLGQHWRGPGSRGALLESAPSENRSWGLGWAPRRGHIPQPGHRASLTASGAATPVFPSSRSLGVPGNAAAPTAAKGTAGASRAQQQQPQSWPQPSSDLVLRPQGGWEGAWSGSHLGGLRNT